MLVIEDNKLKLLRMKEKLLEVSVSDKDKILSQYKEIVLDIDKIMYDSLIKMIKDTNYHNQSLEEQLVFLTNLENEYNSFNEFQCRYRNIYEKYASDRLELSPIEDIYIDKIKKRIDAINGYLINNQNLLGYRKKIEELNLQLIDAEKKKNEIDERFVLLEQELKNNVLNAEGRTDNSGKLEYASIVQEFGKYNLNLKELLNDNVLLEQELSKVNVDVSSEEDKMDAARVCFNNMPNVETKRLYNVSYFDVLNARYRLVLLEFAKLIACECNVYEDIKSKRVKIKELMRERLKLLNDLGVRFVIDPFSRIKIDEQLEIIELLGKNLQGMLLIKEKIKNTFDFVDEINAKNGELHLIISQGEELCNDRSSISLVVDNQEFDVEHNRVEENKVINVCDISDKLNLDLIHEKTKGVINRVYELFSDKTVVTSSQEVVPELVIEKENIFTDDSKEQEIFEDNNLDLFRDAPLENDIKDLVLDKDETFIDESENQSIFNDNVDEDLFDKDSETVTATQGSITKTDNIFEDEITTHEIFKDTGFKEDDSSKIFSEIEPFQETVLFTNKYDDVFANDNQLIVNQKDVEMPDLFFDSEQKMFNDKDEEFEEESELSLDEQIKALKLVP